MQVITKDQASENLKANLRQFMADRGFGVRQLARESDNDAMAVSRIINHGNIPAADCLLRMAEALGVSVESMFKKPPSKKQQKPNVSQSG